MFIEGVKVEIVPLEFRNGKIRFIDVTKLPEELVYVKTDNVERLAKAIERMEIRGAPAIGVAAALGLAMVAYNSKAKTYSKLAKELYDAAERLRKTRPTAYNLFWAINRIIKKFNELKNKPLDTIKSEIVREALSMQLEDIKNNISIGKHGASLLKDGDTVLTHCNTGSLATAGYGTALGIIRYAYHVQKKKIKVIATETRPLLQGARLTAWELVREKIPATLVTDNMVGYVMSKGMVTKVIVGADRILLDGRVANKIGTYSIAVLAKHHNIPFYIAAPTSTIDPKSKEIPIEHRKPEEVKTVLGKIATAPREIEVLNPAFDITPPELITAIITEKGIARPPYDKSIRKMLGLK